MGEVPIIIIIIIIISILLLVESFEHEVTTGITGLWQPSVHSDVAF